MKELVHLKWKNILETLGVSILDFDEYVGYIDKKGIYRYSEIAKELKTTYDRNQVDVASRNLNVKTLNAIYVADILVRREIFRLVSAVEVNIRAMILNELEMSVEQDAHAVVLKLIGDYLSSDAFQKLSPNRKSKAVTRTASLIREVEKVTPGTSFGEFVNGIEFGKLQILLQSMAHSSDYNFELWYDGEAHPRDLVSAMMDLVNVRNGAFHHNSFSRVRKNRTVKPLDILNIVLNFSEMIFGSNSKAIVSFGRRMQEEFAKHDNIIEIKDEIKLIYGIQI